MQGQNYPQEQQYQQPYPQPYQENKGIESHFIAKDKIGLFLFLTAGALILGFLLLDLVKSGLIDGDGVDAVTFLGMLAIDAGVIALFTLMLASGICRQDLSEKTRIWLMILAVVIVVMVIIIYMSNTGTNDSGYTFDPSDWYP